MRNHSMITEFVLLGISDTPELQAIIFFFLFIAYILSVCGNLTIITLTLLDSRLKTPMYFFLQNFSFLEIMFTSVSVPRFLRSIITKVKSISYNNCFAQLFFFISMGVSEFFLLTAMSYDRYVAICKPLHYTIIMSQKVCALLVLSSWLVGFLMIFPLIVDFCASNIIDHFSCDYFPILQLSCSDTRLSEALGLYVASFTLLFTLALVILSYICIISTILRFPSASQRKKAFSTCSSHMIVISISYGSCIFMYGVAVLNTSIAPMLNPFIYTLRNQQVKQAFKDLINKVILNRNK
ncbi:Olfactory receptor 6C3 [Lemmus lemmus]